MINEEDPDFFQDCLKAHGYQPSDCESDEGKSESDDELRRMKPPPISYDEFKHKIIPIGEVYPAPNIKNTIRGDRTDLVLPYNLPQINLESQKPNLIWNLPLHVTHIYAPLIGHPCVGPTNIYLPPSGGWVPSSIYYGIPLIRSGGFGSASSNFARVNGEFGVPSGTYVTPSSDRFRGSEGFGKSESDKNCGGSDIPAGLSHSQGNGCDDGVPTQSFNAQSGNQREPSFTFGDLPSGFDNRDGFGTGGSESSN